MASYYAGAGDGYCDNYTGADWDAIHDRLLSDESSYIATWCNFYWRNDEIVRLFYPINTSGIDDAAVISSASLFIYMQDRWGAANDGSYWGVVVQTTQASSTQLSTADYDQCGSVDIPTEGSTRLDLYPFSSSYGEFQLNSTGISWIKKTDADPYTMLGMRYSYDVLDTGGAFTEGGLTVFFSEMSLTSKDPYLDVEVQTSIYSRGDYSTLPTDTTDLENLFTAGEYTQVATDDGDRVEQRGGA